MAFPQGINFRATSGYVTDGTNETYEIGTSANYPRTTPQGNTVGWEQTSGNARDRSTSVDRRLAGLHFQTIQADFRIDLPTAGSYNVRAAFGDMSSSSDTKWSLLDTTTTLATLATGTNGAAGSFKDATDTLYTAATWPGSNTANTKIFSTTILRVRGSSAVSFNYIAHLYVESAAGSPATYSYTASGGIVFSGAATKTRSIARTASGGIVLSGVAAQSRGAVRSTVGGVQFAGSASQVRGAVRASSGGLTLGGAATVLRGLARTASGGLLFSGASSVSFHSAVQQLIVTPVGGLVISGTAAIVRTCTRLVSGGIKFAGTSPVEYFSILSTGASDFLGFIRRRGRR